MQSLCEFCQLNPPIKNSHILPRWTIQHALDNSVTSQLRDSDSINRPVQDGEKSELLCRVCEQQFGNLEKAVADLFRTGSIKHRMPYQAVLVRFVVSVVWRVGVVRRAELQSKYPRFAKVLCIALETWKSYLQESRADFQPHPVWFAILDMTLAGKVDAFMKTESTDGRGAAPVINRYFANSFVSEMVVYEQDGFVLVWAKTSAWLMAGVIAVPDKTNLTSIELVPSGGILPGLDHQLPPVVLATLGYQSWGYLQTNGEVSSIQRKKIFERWEKNTAKIAESPQTQAFIDDQRMFGDAAWTNLPKPSRETHGSDT